MFCLETSVVLENRATDAAVHFEKARSLSEAKRWTSDQRQRFQRLCYQGTAQLAESGGDWKSAQAAFESWLKLQPGNARARQRLGKTLFRLDLPDAAYKELKKAATDDAALESPDVMMGWLYASAANPKKAGEWMDQAIKQSPNSLPVRMAFRGIWSRVAVTRRSSSRSRREARPEVASGSADAGNGGSRTKRLWPVRGDFSGTGC